MIVYTCVFGHTDILRDPIVRGKSKFLCFTDQPIRSRGWEIIRVPKLQAPKRECRKYKQRPHVLFPDEAVTLWVDAAMIVRVDPDELARLHPHEFSAFVHSKRCRITQECEAIIQCGKAIPDRVRAQLAKYQADGWDTPDNPQTKIHNGGVLLRRNTPKVREFSELWNHEVQTETLRDQMSIDYCAHKVGLEISDFPGTISRNPYFIRAGVRYKPTNDF